MKLNIQFKILVLNLFVVVLCSAIIITFPLHLVSFIFQRKNKLLQFLEKNIFKTLFQINNLKIQHNHGK